MIADSDLPSWAVPVAVVPYVLSTPLSCVVCTWARQYVAPSMVCWLLLRLLMTPHSPHLCGSESCHSRLCVCVLQGRPPILSRYKNPNATVNNVWEPSSVPAVKTQSWGENYQDKNIADNPEHPTWADLLIAPEVCVIVLCRTDAWCVG